MLQHVHILMRVAARQQERLPEHLEGIDDRHDQHKKTGRDQERQRYVPEAGEFPRAVDLRRFIILLRDIVDPRQEKHQVVAAVFPDIQQYQDVKRPACIEPVHRLDPDLCKEAVQDAVLVEKDLPHKDDRGDRYDQRNDEKSPEGRDPFELFIQEDRQRKRQGDDERHAHRIEFQRVPRRSEKGVAGEQVLEIIQSHERCPADAFCKTIVQADDEWRRKEQDEPCNARKCEKIPCRRLFGF